MKFSFYHWNRSQALLFICPIFSKHTHLEIFLDTEWLVDTAIMQEKKKKESEIKCFICWGQMKYLIVWCSSVQNMPADSGSFWGLRNWRFGWRLLNSSQDLIASKFHQNWTSHFFKCYSFHYVYLYLLYESILPVIGL